VLYSTKMFGYGVESKNIIDILRAREVRRSNYKENVECQLETSFSRLEGIDSPRQFPLAESVLSTIAIAISPDGETVATSHGDHTVKIFGYRSGKQIRVFRGHPRTPWTVKYHPTDSNIIASGCLGYEVKSQWKPFLVFCYYLILRSITGRRKIPAI
jgi:WD40 repeat protein